MSLADHIQELAPAALQRGMKWLRFMLSGLPSFLLAVPLNYLLVEGAHWNKSLTYGLLLAMQVAINFFICRRWVFDRRDAQSLWHEFGTFFSGIMGFRLGDWLLYTLLVQVFGLYFLAVQLGNVLLFSVLKFLFSERLFKRQEQPRASPAWPRLLLGLILALAFVLRFGGLNHDLHEWQVYHPDTPKQIRAVERFLDGHYYIHYGDLDYDAYPYFNSHLVEYLIRGAAAGHDALRLLIGLPEKTWRPDYYEIFWITRGWNALLATLLVLVVYRLGTENWDRRAGLAAALLLAVSPADVVACHFAGADTTAGFFATLTVFFALRIYRLGRWRDYALAALCTALGFSTKYHAGMGVLAVLVAHGFRTGSWRALGRGPALLRLAWLAAIGLPATLLSTPTLLTHFSETVTNIWHFFAQISSYRGVDSSIRYGGWGHKLVFAMHRNLPILVWILSPVVCLGALLGLRGLLRRRPDPRTAVLFALPLCYFLVGVSLRPMAHPLYHTLMTPLVFVAAAVVLTRPLDWLERGRPAWAWLRRAALALAALMLGATAAKEAFYFWVQDSGRVAQAWVEENVPPQYALQLGSYTFTSSRFAEPAQAVGRGWATCSPEEPPTEYRLVKKFSWDKDHMAVFRDFPVRFYLNTSGWLRPDFQMPVFQRTASADGNRIVCDNGVAFLRDEKLLELAPEDFPTRRSVIRNVPLPAAWIGVQNGDLPNLVDVEFAGARRRVSLNPGAVVWWSVPAPRCSWPSEPGFDWYRWSAQTFYGDARVLLATQPGELGAFLFNAGSYRDAFPFLQAAAAATHNPTLAALALLCLRHDKLAVTEATQSGLARLAQPLRQVSDAAGCRQVFGIAPAYLDALDFIKLEAANLRAAGFGAIGDLEAVGQRALEKVAATPAAAATNPPPTLLTPVLRLDPGAYTVALRVRGTEATTAPLRWRLVAEDLAGNRQMEAELVLPPLDDRRYTRVTAPFELPLAVPGVRLCFTPLSPEGVVLDQIEIKPDVLGTLRWLQRLPQEPVTPAPAAAGGFRQQADTVFQGGLRLTQVECGSATIARGRPLGLNFQFAYEQPGVDVANLAIFIHFVDATGRTVFQGDYGLADLLNCYRQRLTGPQRFRKTIELPANVPPGDYTLQVGVCRLDSSDRLRILSSPHPRQRAAVVLPEKLRVTE